MGRRRKIKANMRTLKHVIASIAVGVAIDLITELIKDLFRLLLNR